MSSRRRGVWGGLSVALLASLMAGCGGGAKIYPVEGKVLVKGEPAVGAVVYFHLKGKTDPSAPTPSGTAGADGTFRLTTPPLGEGAPVGEYEVSVYWPDTGTGSDKEGSGAKSDSPPDKLGSRYLKPGPHSPTAVVKAENNKLAAFNLE